MRPVAIDEIVPLERYAPLRRAYREAVIEHKRQRRIAVGDRVTLVFEDHETLLFQIQEMLWIERISDPAKVQDEIDVYNELLPGLNELSATLFVEITDTTDIRSELDRLIGIDEHVSLVFGEGADEQRSAALFDPKQSDDDRISAVQYLRFPLDDERVRRLTGDAAPPRIVIDHPSYRHQAAIPPAVRQSLGVTLRGNPSSLMPENDGRPAGPEPEILFDTPRIRALRLPPGGLARAVVESKLSSSLLEADPELLAELADALQRAAREVVREHGRCRVWTEVGPGQASMRWFLVVPER